MRWIGGVLLVSFLLAVFLAASLTTLLTTERGTRWLMRQVIDWSQAPVEVANVTGSVWHGLRAERVRYATDRLAVEVSDIEIDADWGRSLLNDRIVLRRLHAARVAVHAAPPDEEPEARTLQVPAPPIPLEVDSFEVDEIVYNEVDPSWLPKVSGSVTWDAEGLEVETVRAEAARYELRGGAGAGVGTEPDIRADVEGSLRLNEVITGKLSFDGPLNELAVAAQLSSPWQLEARGTVDARVREPMVNLALTSPELSWQQYRSKQITGEVSGTRAAYRGSVTGELELPFEVTGTAHVQFSGSDRMLDVTAAEFKSAAGDLRGRANIAWAPAIQVTFAATVSDAGLERWRPGLDGIIGGDLEGEIDDGQITVRLHELRGRIEGHEVSGRGRLNGTNGTWELADVELMAGANRATGSGRWSEGDLLASVDFDLKDIGTFLPDGGGDLRGSAEVKGAAGEWSGTARARSSSIRWRDVALSGATLNARRSAQTTELSLSMDAAQASANSIEGLTLRAQGPDRALETELAWRAPWGASALKAVLAIEESAVRAVVSQGSSLGVPGGEWRLDKSTVVRAQRDDVQIGPHCWRAEESRLCVTSLAWTKSEWQAAARLDELPVSYFAWLDPRTRTADGTIQGSWQLAGTTDGIRGNGRFVASGLGVRDPEFPDDVIGLPDVTVEVQAAPELIETQVRAGGDTGASIDGLVRLGGLAPDAPLGGSIRMRLDNLTAVATVSERVANTEGQLSGLIDLAGTRSAPLVTGRLELREAGFEWLEPYVKLSNLNLDARLSEDQRIVIEGRGRTPDGEVRIEGVAENILSASRNARVVVTGDTVTARLPDMSVTVRPELTLTWSEGTARLTGTVFVPRANIKVTELPATATALSRDVVVVGREQAAAANAYLATDLRVELGEDVKFSAFGLSTELEGNLRLRQAVSGELSLVGRINLAGGEYSAYGRKLTIESGRLIFQGAPDNPDVDVRAVRRIERSVQEDVIVGVRVQGPAKALETTLFSDPTMSDADALAYIITGRPLNQASQSEGEAVSGAAVAMGLAQAAGIVNQVRNMLGLDELGAGEAMDQQTTLVAGKQLSSRLYARYTFNTFTRLSALLLRYDLTGKLSLEATAGEFPGMDVIYRVGD